MRGFTRFYTAVLGVLAEGLLDTPYSVTEARILFELAQRDETAVTDLRRELRIDAGYASRILQSFEDDGLVTRTRAPGDARRQLARLTTRGRETFAVLDRRSDVQVAAMLSDVDPADRPRLVDALAAVRAILAGAEAPRGQVVLRRPRAGEYGWVVARHGAVYAAEYGWDETFEGLVARVVADYAEDNDPTREAAWIAEVAGTPAGCIFCVHEDAVTAKLRLLLVEPWARGLGLGTRLVGECVQFARAAGYRRLTLWTNDVLTSARRIYEASGFELVAEEPHRRFGHDLVGQWWALTL